MNVGIVGCGYWGPNLVRSMVETNRCEQVLCYDQNPNALAKLLRRFPNVVPASNLDELIDRSDAVMIATPASTHAALASTALRARRSVFVEKPLATSALDAADLVDLARNKSVTLMVGHTFIYSPPVRKVKEYISKGLLGEIYFITSSRVNLGIHQSDIDVLWDLAPHDLSILLYWLEEQPWRVSAVARACVGRLPDVATLHYQFPSGILANIEISWLAPSKLRRTVLVGSKSMVVYDDTQPSDKVRLYDRGANLKAPETFGEYQLTYRTGDVISPNIDATEPLFLEMNHFLDCVESGAKPDTNGTMGLDVVLALEAASLSMHNNGRFVDVELSAGSLRKRAQAVSF